MKKLVDVQIYKDKITVTNNTVHKLDKNVVVARCHFNYNYGQNLEGIKAILISQNGNLVTTSERTIKDNECTFELNNALFHEVGISKSVIKLVNEEKELYINDDFLIHIVGKESPSNDIEDLGENNLVLKRNTVEEEIKKIANEVFKGIELPKGELGLNDKDGKDGGSLSIPLAYHMLNNKDRWEILEFTGQVEQKTGSIKIALFEGMIAVIKSDFEYALPSDMTITEETKSKLKEDLYVASAMNFTTNLNNRLEDAVFSKDGKIKKETRGITQIFPSTASILPARTFIELSRDGNISFLQSGKFYKLTEITATIDDFMEKFKSAGE